MMKYELENFMKPFLGEIEIIIELDDGNEISTGTAEAKYHMAANGTGYIKLVPSSVLTRKNSIETHESDLRLIRKRKEII